jgi:hypothetical protein
VAKVYSQQFASTPGLIGLGTLVVPAGELWIVRDISLYNVHSSSITASVFAGTGGTMFIVDILTANTYAHQEGRWVLPAGDSLNIFSTAACNFFVSGYNLSLP